jgi:lycopene beta-cyclase
MAHYDVILVGGGLANGLIAHFLKEVRPEVSFLLLESENQLGGDHTWSFHGTDVSPHAFEMIKPLISYSWKNYEVHFPKYQREIDISYHSILSRDFHKKLMEKLQNRVRLSCPVKELGKNYVITASGEKWDSLCVIDGRGWSM